MRAGISLSLVFFCLNVEVDDVYIPRPFRNFAFVTFREAGIASNLIGQEFYIQSTLVSIGPATPKTSVSPLVAGQQLQAVGSVMYGGVGQAAFYGQQPATPEAVMNAAAYRLAQQLSASRPTSSTVIDQGTLSAYAAQYAAGNSQHDVVGGYQGFNYTPSQPADVNYYQMGTNAGSNGDVAGLQQTNSYLKSQSSDGSNQQAQLTTAQLYANYLNNKILAEQRGSVE